MVHFGRQLAVVLPASWQIVGRLLCRKISPALKGAAGDRLRPDDFFIQNDPAAPDPTSINDLVKAQDALAALDKAFDYPVERTASQDFFIAFRPHTCRVPAMPVLAADAGRFLPFDVAVNGFGANAEFYQVYRVLIQESRSIATT